MKFIVCLKKLYFLNFRIFQTKYEKYEFQEKIRMA